MKNFLNIIISIFVVLLIICLSIKTTLYFKPLYYFSIENLNIYENTTLTKEEIVDNYNYLIQYISNHKEIDFELPSLPSSTEGVIHFEEVKELFIFMDLLILISLGVIAIVLLFNKLNNIHSMNIFNISSILIFLIPILLLIPSLINFNYVFTIMHNIVFRNDYWLFNPNTDPVINLLPEKYFFYCFVMIIALILIAGVLFKIIYHILKRKFKESIQ